MPQIFKSDLVLCVFLLSWTDSCYQVLAERLADLNAFVYVCVCECVGGLPGSVEVCLCLAL